MSELRKALYKHEFLHPRHCRDCSKAYIDEQVRQAIWKAKIKLKRHEEIEPSEMMTIKEVAKFLNVHYSSARRMMINREIPVVIIKCGVRKHLVRTPRAELMKWIANEAGKPPIVKPEKPPRDDQALLREAEREARWNLKNLRSQSSPSQQV